MFIHIWPLSFAFLHLVQMQKKNMLKMSHKGGLIVIIVVIIPLIQFNI